MAEYYISYNDMFQFIEDNLKENDENVNKYKAEILTALTGDFEAKKFDDISEMVSLWDNQIIQPSELLLGTRYIRVSDVAMFFIEVALNSGLFEALIAFCLEQPIDFEMTGVFDIVLSIQKLISSVCTLDDMDFCIYMQAVTHFRKHKEFDINDLKDWFPQTSNRCNMHTSKWNCTYYNNEDDTCSIMSSDNLNKALESLEKKGILRKEYNGEKYTFQFKK